MSTTTVRNAFEIFGAGFPEHCEPSEAEAVAMRIAEQCAESCYQREGDNAVIRFPSSQMTGFSNEIEFQQQLALEAGATEEIDGKIPWDDLVAWIRKMAIEVAPIGCAVAFWRHGGGL